MYHTLYSGPCNLRPLHFTIPSILRPAISDTILLFSIQISLYFKTTSNLHDLRPKFYGRKGSLKMQGPLYMYHVYHILNTLTRHCILYYSTIVGHP